MNRITWRIIQGIGAGVLTAMIGMAVQTRAADDQTPTASPTTNPANELVKREQAAANLRKIAQALEQYSNEYNQTFPRATFAVVSPATQQAPSDAHALVKQLGADEFQSRQDAAEQLRKLGKDALAALKEGANSTDPEIKTRCQEIIKELADKDQPKVQPDADENDDNNGPAAGMVIHGQMQGGVVIINGQMAVQAAVNIHGANGARDAAVSENGVLYSFHIDPNNVVMVVAAQNGVSTTFRAKDLDDLKKNQPEAYKIYLHYFAAKAKPGVMLQVGPPATAPAAVEPATPP